MSKIGAIDREWASRVSDHAYEIYQHNHRNADEIHRDINLEMLAGLTVNFCLDDPVSREAREQIRLRRTIIDLAFAEDGFGTSTSLLLAASNVQYGTSSQLSQQLEERTKPTLTHGDDETWFIPTSAVEFIEASRV